MAKILIIDDEQDILDILRQLLEAFGHEITEAKDGREGLQHFEDDHPDLVITDIFMGNINGLTLIKEIKAKQTNARIIAISGGGVEKDMSGLEEAKQLGADETFEKPFDLEEVLAAANRLIG